MSANAPYIILQYLVHGGAALAGFLLSAFLLGDPAPLIAVKTIFSPACLLALKGFNAHFRRNDNASMPLWQMLEYSAAQGMIIASWGLIMTLDLDRSGTSLLGQFAIVATACGATEAFLTFRKRRQNSNARM